MHTHRQPTIYRNIRTYTDRDRAAYIQTGIHIYIYREREREIERETERDTQPYIQTGIQTYIHTAIDIHTDSTGHVYRHQ